MSIKAAVSLINTIDCDVTNHAELLKSIIEVLLEIDQSNANPYADDLRRVTALALIARDMNDATAKKIKDGFKPINADRRAKHGKKVVIDIDPSAFSIEALWQLNDALDNMSDMLSGLICQPRFSGNGPRELTPAGEWLDVLLTDGVDTAMGNIIREVEARKPATEHEQAIKFALLAEQYTDGSGAVGHMAAGIRAIAERIEAEGVVP